MIDANLIKKYSDKSIPWLIKKAEEYFNRFIRQRDKNLGCISCAFGQVEHAGHYFAAGNYSVIRFNEHNVNGQCNKCNTHLSGNQAEYRIRLVKKIGLDKVEYLEGIRHYPHKWDKFSLIEIIIKYKNLSK